jgi:hypothetical protein
MKSTARVAVRGTRFWLSIAASASVATFALGLAAGSNLSRAGDLTGSVSRVAPAPALDTSQPFLTVQHGVIVPAGGSGSGAVRAPALDTSQPFLTVQHGVIVAGGIDGQGLDTSKPYLTIQNGFVVPGR